MLRHGAAWQLDWRGQWGDNGDGLVISKSADECAELLKQPEKLGAPTTWGPEDVAFKLV